MTSGASAPFALVVHATHEAGIKLGGIGAVLSGLLSAPAYTNSVARTVLVGPINTRDPVELERLQSPSNGLKIHFSSYHRIDELASALSARLRAIEDRYSVRLLYGMRAFGHARHEVILIDSTSADVELVNVYKGSLYEQFGVQSDRYEHLPEYESYVSAAEPSYEALQVITGEVLGPKVMIAHEFMGLPLCYSAAIHDRSAYRIIFYGHEVATIRQIVESHPGHDTMFYNVMACAQQEGQYLEDVFGEQSAFFKHALIRSAPSFCDNIFAVGDRVVQEMRFLGSDWQSANIDLVYNGVPSYDISIDAKEASRALLQQYCQNLLGFRPDLVFTHVTRLVVSKGMWRDIRVMEHLDPLLAEQGRSAVLFALSSIIPVGRPAKAVREMEASYGWPVTHRDQVVQVDGHDVPDLVSHEIPFYKAIEAYNQTAKASKIVLVNQFGWSQEQCGRRMPKSMAFADIRQGSDLEFGQSIYEPFGIAQLEPLSSGALCVVSSVCGCLGFVRRVGGAEAPNVVVADYTDLGAPSQTSNAGSVEAPESLTAAALAIGQDRRDRIEAVQARIVAQEIARRLPRGRDETQKYLNSGCALSQSMNWQTVAQNYLLPGLRRALDRRTPTKVSLGRAPCCQVKEDLC
jgi:hypothetical protein